MDRKDFEKRLKSNPELDKIIAQSLFGKSPAQDIPLSDSVIGTALKTLPERPQVQESKQVSPEQALSFLQFLQKLNQSPSLENGQELPLWMQPVDAPDYYSAYDFIQGAKPSPLESWQKLFERTNKPVQMNYKDKTPITADEQQRMKEEIPGLMFLGEGGVDTNTLAGNLRETVSYLEDLRDEAAVKAVEDNNKAKDFQTVLQASLIPKNPELERYQNEQMYRALNYGIPTDVSQIEKEKEEKFWKDFQKGADKVSTGINAVDDFVTGFTEGIGKGTEIAANGPVEALKEFWNSDVRKGVQDLANFLSGKILKGEWVEPGQGGQGFKFLPENFQLSGLATKPGEWLFNALNRKERNDITARKQDRAKASTEALFAQNAIAPVGTSEVSTTAKTGKVARKLNGGIPEDARVKWTDVKGAVDKLKEKPEKADDARWYDAFSAIGNAIGTWSFDPKTGSLTKTESNGPSIDDIIAGNAKRRLEGEELEQKRSQANANALLDLMKLQEPRSLGGSTIYDPQSGEYHQTESALTQIAKAQLMNQQLSGLKEKAETDAQFAAWWGGLSDKERKKYLPMLMLQKKAGIPLSAASAAFGG